jgi:hypothetical protein
MLSELLVLNTPSGRIPPHGTMVESASQLPLWTVIAFWVYLAYRFLSAARAEDLLPGSERATPFLLSRKTCAIQKIL